MEFHVGNTLGTFEDLWWHCECKKHSKYYERMIKQQQGDSVE